MQGLVIAPPIHAVGADVGDQGILGGILTGAEAPLKFCGGQPARPCHIKPLCGGVEVAGLIGPQVPIPQGAGKLVPVRGGDDAAPVLAVADVQPGGQLLGRLHDLGVGLPQRELQEPQRHHVLALPVIGEQRQTLHQVDGVCAPLEAQGLLVGGGQGSVSPDGIGQGPKMMDVQRSLPQIIHHVELQHGHHLSSMPSWAGLSVRSWL